MNFADFCQFNYYANWPNSGDVKEEGIAAWASLLTCKAVQKFWRKCSANYEPVEQSAIIMPENLCDWKHIPRKHQCWIPPSPRSPCENEVIDVDSQESIEEFKHKMIVDSQEPIDQNNAASSSSNMQEDSQAQQANVDTQEPIAEPRLKRLKSSCSLLESD